MTFPSTFGHLHTIYEHTSSTSFRHATSSYRYYIFQLGHFLTFHLSFLPSLIISVYTCLKENIPCSLHFPRVIQCWALPVCTFFLQLQKVFIIPLPSFAQIFFAHIVAYCRAIRVTAQVPIVLSACHRSKNTVNVFFLRVVII
jgi:hypothetical protein